MCTCCIISKTHNPLEHPTLVEQYLSDLKCFCSDVFYYYAHIYVNILNCIEWQDNDETCTFPLEKAVALIVDAYCSWNSYELRMCHILNTSKNPYYNMEFKVIVITSSGNFL